jgi:curli production assembly/transport component CsgE
MRIFLRQGMCCAITIVCILSMRGMAQEPEAKLPRSATIETPQSGVDVVGGAIIDQSVTFIGQNFYQAFVQQWSELDPGERFTIVVKERPTARFGSFISVEYQGLVTYRTSLSVRSRGTIGQTAEAAASQVMGIIAEMEAEKLFQADSDVGSGEL